MPTKHPADRGELGRRGEALACARLTAAGLRIVARNWRCQTGEIDVVAEGPGLLVFCEVKTRRGDGYGTPAAAVDAANQGPLPRAGRRPRPPGGRRRPRQAGPAPPAGRSLPPRHPAPAVPCPLRCRGRGLAPPRPAQGRAPDGSAVRMRVRWAP